MHAHLAGDVAEDMCPFSSLTRNVALGRFSVTSPCISMTSSFAMSYLVGRPAPLKFAFFSRLSYWCDITNA